MATPNLNGRILIVAHRLQQTRTDPTAIGDSGQRYSSLLLAGYVNRAVREFLTQSYERMGPDTFTKLFTEYIKTTTPTLTLVGGVVAKPADAWYFISLSKSDFSVDFYKLRQNEISSVLTKQNGEIVPSAADPAFYEEGANLFVLPNVAPISGWAVSGRYIVTHQDLTPYTDANPEADLVLNANWYGAVEDIAVQHAIQDAKNGIV